MALCNIIGDFCYLGFAFAADGFVSVPKLAGACFTLLAHTILLAYGDSEMKKVADEHGVVANMIMGLRDQAQRVMEKLPSLIKPYVQAKPIGICFSMLALNGAGLVVDALINTTGSVRTMQTVLGVFIATGCYAFAVADFVKGQRSADIITKIAPSILALATAAGAVLAILTLNPFLMLGATVFAFANIAGFYTKVDKSRTISNSF